LVAAALAKASRAAARALHREKLSIRIELLDLCGEGIDGLAEDAAAAVGIIQGLSDLIVSNEVLELGTSFAAEALLQPSSSGLANAHTCCATQVGLEGVGSAVHLLLLHGILLFKGTGTSVIDFKILSDKTRNVIYGAFEWSSFGNRNSRVNAGYVQST
jgi:hypothetical protein